MNKLIKVRDINSKFEAPLYLVKIIALKNSKTGIEEPKAVCCGQNGVIDLYNLAEINIIVEQNWE
jgi:ribosomal protein L35AE/L33A